MPRFTAFLFGAVAYLTFVFTILYAIGFVSDFVVPKSIDAGVKTPISEAVAINLALMFLFAIQHSVMARPAFKQWSAKIFPAACQRSTYVLLSSLILLLLFWQWRPIPRMIWDAQSPAGRAVLTGLFWLGWVDVLFSTYLVDHFGLFGLKQVYRYCKGVADVPPPFKTPSLYKMVRHPLYLGFIVAFWSTPRMTERFLL